MIDPQSPIIIFTSGNYMQAHLVASILNGSDIPASVIDDNMSRIYPWGNLLAGGAKVIVSPENLEPSREVLAGVEAGDSPIAGECLPIPLSEPAILITLFRKCLRAALQPHPPQKPDDPPN